MITVWCPFKTAIVTLVPTRGVNYEFRQFASKNNSYIQQFGRHSRVKGIFEPFTGLILTLTGTHIIIWVPFFLQTRTIEALQMKGTPIHSPLPKPNILQVSTIKL